MPISKNFIMKHVADEYMIIPLSGTGVNMTKTFNINETGAYIYNCLQEGLNAEETAKKMQEEYDAPYEVLYKDVNEFIEILKEKGIYNE